MYVFAVFAAFPAPIKDSTKGGGRPSACMGAGKVANTAKTYIRINTYALNIYMSCIYFNIVLYIFPRNPILEDQILEECWGLLLGAS